MSNSCFRFKQFTVFHDRCAMKVGTDAVVLGTWANAPEGPVLDVGTGSGVIALIMAQRYPAHCIWGVELDANAAGQAGENFKNSPFTNRLQIVQCNFLTPSLLPRSFGSVVCNPPYFAHHKLPPDQRRQVARHHTNFNLYRFFARCFELTGEQARVSLVYPYEAWGHLQLTAGKAGWFLHRQTLVRGNSRAPVKRVLTEWQKQPSEKPAEMNLVLETERRGQYTPEFARMVTPFYL